MSTPYAPAPAAIELGVDLCVGWAKKGEAGDATMRAIVRRNAVGEWALAGHADQVDLEAGTSLADIDTVRILDGRTVIFGGHVRPTGSAGAGGLEVADRGDGPEFTLSGPDVFAALATRRAYPTPSTEPPWADSHHLLSGAASTVAAGYISANLGSTALAARQVPGLVVVDGTEGTIGQWSARLQPLDQLVARVCADGGIVCLVDVDFDGILTFTLRQPADLSGRIVLSDQGDLVVNRQRRTPASATFVIAGGSGQLTARTFATAGAATGTARIETFADQTNLATTGEVEQAAATALALGDADWSVTAELALSAAQRLRYLVEYRVGDVLGVEIADVRYSLPVESVLIEVNDSRHVVTPTFGAATRDLFTGLVRDIGDLQSRFDTQIA